MNQDEFEEKYNGFGNYLNISSENLDDFNKSKFRSSRKFKSN